MKDFIAAKLSAAGGRRIGDDEAARLSAELGWIPAWFVDLMRQYPLAGARFVLDEEDIDMRWLDPAKIIDQALDVYPGIAASREQYIPFGLCLFGTGETYFV
ncbi:MAG TPA: hypothetical protein VHK90_15560 [Thermoanaerobaculia bacterium]|nr:hypothetical protein [Thermoanaerobaculia bacterium]